MALNSPADKEQLTQAGLESERLDQEITARYGEAHPHTINIRELRGWLALLLGQPGVATRWHLHTVGLQTEVWGPTHQLTQGSAQRAVHAWLKIDDPQEGAVIGRELLAMLATVLGEDSKVTRRALRRLEKITAQL
ncbi:hypothetical protein SBI_04833 [Streptomyces bingchenggensis BCW-1]|uniref:Uncharacterized protein n=1 Tax=Streptomyces bingchenggensis (strain BCW-1) TaxID=749414 RepID=D7C152_STRBB|nr:MULTISPECIES: hypothetical protein [Streptomyces]ADI07953.1 hypothetical protein SBI_04833 [Streptomyces bingchenggensis BCW-1]